MSRHLADFTHHLIGRHGPRTTGEIAHAFMTVGNTLKGADLDERLEAVRAVLTDDKRFKHPELGDLWSYAEPAAAAAPADAE